jgi:hypothetical protein
MTDPGAYLPPGLAPLAFLLFFATMWLVVTTILSLVSGWYELMRRFPDRSDKPVLALANQSGKIGLVAASRILNLSVCPSGLRVGMMRIFGPFSRPFFVPWEELRVTRQENWMWRSARMEFGLPSVGDVTVAAELADTLARAAGSHWPEPGPFPVEVGGQAAARIFKQWLLVTACAATFFTVAPRIMNPRGTALPIAVAILFPAIFFGVVSLVRFFFRNRS